MLDRNGNVVVSPLDALLENAIKPPFAFSLAGGLPEGSEDVFRESVAELCRKVSGLLDAKKGPHVLTIQV